MSVTVRLEDDIDVSRGDMICRPQNAPTPSQDIDAMVCWMSSTPLQPRQKLAIKHTTRLRRALIKDVQYRLDVNSLHRDLETKQLGLNEIGRVQLRTTMPLLCDPYETNRTTGSFILIDEATGVTVGAGMINPGQLSGRQLARTASGGCVGLVGLRGGRGRADPPRVDEHLLGGGYAVGEQLRIDRHVALDQREPDRAELVVPRRRADEADLSTLERHRRCRARAAGRPSRRAAAAPAAAAVGPGCAPARPSPAPGSSPCRGVRRCRASPVSFGNRAVVGVEAEPRLPARDPQRLEGPHPTGVALIADGQLRSPYQVDRLGRRKQRQPTRR